MHTGERKRWISGRDNRSMPVAAAACSSYEPEEAAQAMARVLELTDGLGFVRKGMIVAIKVNLVAGMHPDQAATTHPVLAAALIKELIRRGAQVVVGDSPGGIYTEAYVSGIYKRCGFKEEDLQGACLNHDFSVSHAVFPEAVSIRTFSYTGWLDKADAIINFSKLKTHAMMAMSCSVKNLFGTIPGTTKPEYHMRFPDSAAFANLMVDLNEYFTPVLNIVDAVDAMEGNGPTAGTPRHVGVLLASKSPYDLDMICARMMRLGREDVPTLQEAYRRKLGPASASQVLVAGDKELTEGMDFQLVSRKKSTTFAGEGPFGKLVSEVGQWALRTRPNVRAGECIGCARCAQICPAKAIVMKDKKPVIDRDKCIRCFCCQEFCPKGAMRVQHTLIGKLVSFVNQGGRSRG